MFVAKFNQVSSDSSKFTVDVNGNFPFIGTILGGTAKSSIINGTIFERNKLKENTLYLCNNKYDATYNNFSVEIIAQLGALEGVQVAKELGTAKLNTAVAEKAVTVEEESF